MKYFVTTLFVIAYIHLNAQTPLDKIPKARITFDRHQINPNEMTQNKDFPDTYNYTFHFKNTGKEPVLFTRCQCPCGCYVVREVPKQIFKQGDEGEFSVSFHYREGRIDKSVFLHTNIPDSTDPGGYKRYEFKVVGEFKK